MKIANNTDIYGTIDPSVRLLENVTEHFSIGYSNMGGTLPTELFKLQAATDLNLGYAKFYGTIPEEISALHNNLQGLQLNFNNFSGPIPPAFDELTSLGKHRVFYCIFFSFIDFVALLVCFFVLSFVFFFTRVCEWFCPLLFCGS